MGDVARGEPWRLEREPKLKAHAKAFLSHRSGRGKLPRSMNPAPVSFSVYLAQLLVAREGYQLGTVPEAEALAGGCDVILTLADGMALSIICIVDAETNASKSFGMGREAVQEIGARCREKYSGRMNGVRTPVSISIIEVQAQWTEAEATKLDGLGSRRGTVIRPYLVGLSTRSVRRSTWFLVDSRRRMLARVLRAPRSSAQELVESASVDIVPQVQSPRLTFGLLALFALVFALEQLVAVLPASGVLEPSGATLMALGGLLGTAVREGEWYRLLTCAFLHASPLHLIFNGIAFYMAGTFLEVLVGRGWLLAVFFVSALGGSAMSIALNGAQSLSVGASGAIMGMLATMLVLAFRVPVGPARSQAQSVALRVLIPSLIPMAGLAGRGGHIDIGSHLGGALVGAVFGFGLLKTWSLRRANVPWKAMAAGLAVVGSFATGYGAVALARALPSARLEGKLIPPDALPKTDEDILEKAAELLAQYPQDPRSHLFNASRLRHLNDLEGSDEELWTALTLTAAARRLFKPNLEWLERRELAKSLLEQGRREEAREVAAPVCGNAPAEAELKARGLCP